MNRLSSLCLLTLGSVALSSCQTVPAFSKAQQEARIAMESQIPKEPLGDYYIGRRDYKVDYKMWGYLRKPRESWADARLVMFNEEKVLAPDRAANTLGSDNGYEYKIWGTFSGDTVYEPASNLTYPEFVLKKTQLLSTSPAPIFKNPKALDPEERYYPNPY